MTLLTVTEHAATSEEVKKAYSVEKLFIPTGENHTKPSTNQESVWSVEVHFQKDSSQLSQSDQEKIRELTNKTIHSGEASEVIVISWADHLYPSHGNKSFSHYQNALLNRRNSQIKEFLRLEASGLEVNLIQMDERPELLITLLKTASEKTRKMIESAGLRLDQNHELTYTKIASRALIIGRVK